MLSSFIFSIMNDFEGAASISVNAHSEWWIPFSSMPYMGRSSFSVPGFIRLGAPAGHLSGLIFHISKYSSLLIALWGNPMFIYLEHECLSLPANTYFLPESTEPELFDLSIFKKLFPDIGNMPLLSVPVISSIVGARSEKLMGSLTILEPGNSLGYRTAKGT